MTNIRIILVLITGLVSFSLMASEANTAEAASEAISQAESTRIEAQKRGFEWSTTKKLIAIATEASHNGDMESAIKLAKKALKEAENSIKQADYAAKNWEKFAL